MTKKNEGQRIAFVTSNHIFSGTSIVPSVRGNLQEPYKTHNCEQGEKITKRDNIPIFLSEVFMYNFNTGFLEYFPNGNLSPNDISFGYMVSGEYSADSKKADDRMITKGILEDNEDMVIIDMGGFRLKGIVKKINDLMVDSTRGPQNVVLSEASILLGSPRFLGNSKCSFNLGDSTFPVNKTFGERLNNSSVKNYSAIFKPGDDFITFNNQFVTFYRR